jgi:hypothetical protein
VGEEFMRRRAATIETKDRRYRETSLSSLSTTVSVALLFTFYGETAQYSTKHRLAS